ncbi:hypothetical protein [Reichenbachiella sp. MALMAid0571]|uniref:hypothetical protein n=1 Tax=Reichenbachiella sp. MALMAid0571 TaxID=3143939 RepID=UPI0032DF1C7C
MAGKRKKFFETKYVTNSVIVGRESSLIRRNFPFLETKLQNGILYCYGEYQPTEYSVTYKYRIKYNGFRSPSVTVLDPFIEYNDDIHMYPQNRSLCLYHKTDLVWDTQKHHIHELIVPWTHEWFIFYELYLLSGKWEHPFVAHNKNEKHE